MKTFDEVLKLLEARVDRLRLEKYIAREWLRPVSGPTGWIFEEIDVARLELICHLTHDIQVNDDGVDVALSLLDQLYGARVYMHKLTLAIARQPPQIQTEIMTVIRQMIRTEEKP